MGNNIKIKSIIFAILAAIFYAINIPLSKILLQDIGSTMMASFLYLGAGIGIGILSIIINDNIKANKLDKNVLPFVIGMILLDIAAPIFLMLGIKYGTSTSTSLLGNFEIVATSIIALIVFKEIITKRLWMAIVLITISSMILSFADISNLKFSYGSAFVLLATICWGFENNCTRMISSKDTFEIVILKGIFSGLGSFVIAILVKEKIPSIYNIVKVLLLGFIAYGLSIFMYVKAQKELGASKTSAFYSINPFIGAFLGFLFLKEKLDLNYFIALIIMILGTILIIKDTLLKNHS